MDREIVKQNIYNRLSGVEKLLADMLPSEEVYVDIHKYIQYVRKDSRGLEIWTDAFNVALREEKAIYIPKAEQPYYIDGSVIIPSQYPHPL